MLVGCLLGAPLRLAVKVVSWARIGQQLVKDGAEHGNRHEDVAAGRPDPFVACSSTATAFCRMSKIDAAARSCARMQQRARSIGTAVRSARARGGDGDGAKQGSGLFGRKLIHVSSQSRSPVAATARGPAASAAAAAAASTASSSREERGTAMLAIDLET